MKQFTPIPVKSVRFASPQDGIGLSVAANVTTSDQPNRPGHTIEYWPWVRSFRLVHHTPGQKCPEAFFIPEHRVMYWIPGAADEAMLPKK